MSWGFCNVKVEGGLVSGGTALGGDFPQSLPVCVVKIWREMGTFTIHIGAGGVSQHGHVSQMVLQYVQHI